MNLHLDLHLDLDLHLEEAIGKIKPSVSKKDERGYLMVHSRLQGGDEVDDQLNPAVNFNIEETSFSKENQLNEPKTLPQKASSNKRNRKKKNKRELDEEDAKINQWELVFLSVRNYIAKFSVCF